MNNSSAAPQNENARSRAAQLRLKAIRAQIAAAFTYCSTAESALALARIQHGRAAIRKASHVARQVRAHLAEPRHVPSDSVACIEDELAQLENRITELGEKFPAVTR